MEYKFSLDETDYLTHQLFIVSISKPAIWRRRRSWAIMTGMFLILALLFHRSANQHLTNYFLVVSAISLVFYPAYSAWRYKKHYKKHVNENFSKTFGQEVTIEFGTDFVLTRDQEQSESKINYSQVDSIFELPEHFLMRMKNGQSLIMPKFKISNLDELRKELTELAKKLNLELLHNMNWKWK